MDPAARARLARERAAYGALAAQCKGRAECMQQVWQLCGGRTDCVTGVVTATQVGCCVPSIHRCIGWARQLHRQEALWAGMDSDRFHTAGCKGHASAWACCAQAEAAKTTSTATANSGGVAAAAGSARTGPELLQKQDQLLQQAGGGAAAGNAAGAEQAAAAGSGAQAQNTAAAADRCGSRCWYRFQQCMPCRAHSKLHWWSAGMSL